MKEEKNQLTSGNESKREMMSLSPLHRREIEAKAELELMNAKFRVEMAELMAKANIAADIAELEVLAKTCGITVEALGQEGFIKAMLKLREMQIREKMYTNSSPQFVFVGFNALLGI